MQDDTHELDLSGLKCPLPVLKAKKKLRELPSGARLKITTTDPMAVIDFPHFCGEEGHTLLNVDQTNDGHEFLLQRK